MRSVWDCSFKSVVVTILLKVNVAFAESTGQEDAVVPKPDLDAVASVPFGSGHLTVWKWAGKIGNVSREIFYMQPLADLIQETVKCRLVADFRH